ncbi:TraR/DksA C4-type zinc finger protein [Sulfurovum sp. XTW-4]|uniref:TraR/DksA C4-type zinc finger protein n=1 Tax=Sulfurovum xiamenensis TaxID=3019066 RepID=A0ABT7QRS7_9BACT|nr:TraR/DksA C4-type zinc finger protein [Sulfurovum xiamenensis]MDM5263720.1 TraR/DksA C4-type zinc finger protein [Sulfurovum xiamenensis]
MTQEERDEIKVRIETSIHTLKEQIAILEEKVKPIAPDCSLGRLTRLEAMGEQHVNNKIMDESKLRLTRLTNALLRIDKPMLGICIECEEPIKIERMRIRPESVRCVECANLL